MYIWFPATSVVSVRYSGPLWDVTHLRCHDSLMNIKRETLGATSGPRVPFGAVGSAFLIREDGKIYANKCTCDIYRSDLKV